ncbi:hypothetical protein Tco_1285922 [Tanacetum coccineum]
MKEEQFPELRRREKVLLINKVRQANERTDKQDEGTFDRTKQSTIDKLKMMKTIAQVLVTMDQSNRRKKKQIKHRNVEDIERPRPTSQPKARLPEACPKIDQK